MKTIQSGMKEIPLLNGLVKPTDIIDKPLLWKVGLILISWIAIIGFDFLWHAGILAALYTRPNPALLDARKLFIRIPFGYASFLVFVIMIYWLFLYIDIRTLRHGIFFGFKFGILLGVASTLGQYSILIIDPVMLIGWGVGQIIEFSMIGGIVGAANSGTSLKTLFVTVIMLVIVLVILTIILQFVGLAPAMLVAE